MASDFTVIQAVRQRFGDDEDDVVESNAPFVGLSKDFIFSCPGIDGSKFAVLQFETIGVGFAPHILRINGLDIPGGLTVSPVAIFDRVFPVTRPDGSVDIRQSFGVIPFWKSHTLLVPERLLNENNVLHIECVPADDGVDDFVIDNIVIFYKLRTSGGRTGGGTIFQP